MHTYATDAEDRRIVPPVLAVLAIGATLLLVYVVGLLKIQIPWYIDTPSVMGFYGIFYGLYNRWLWNKHIGPFHFSAIPYVGGVWAGIINSSYEGGAKINAVISIKQTWQKISIRLETETSTSHTIMAALETEDSLDPGLKYEYMSEPEPHAAETMHIHRGTGHLHLSPDGKRLVGDYYTGRERKTYGTLDLHFVSHKIIGREEALRSIPQPVI
jgi:SMODS-associating 2TM, beta-strand rich effector domain